MRPRKTHPRIAFLGALMALLAAPAAFAAAEPTPSELSVARRLFEEARAAEDAGRWREAAEKFQQATGIKDTPGMRFHLARCDEELGELVEALVEFDRARELIEGGARAPDVEKLLASAREHVRAKVALLTVRLPAEVHNVSVELDGKPLNASVLGVPMPLNPGQHRVKAVAVGRSPFTSELSLSTGEVRQLGIELPVAAATPSAKASEAPLAATPPSASTPPQATDRGVRSAALSPRTVVLVGEATVFVAALGTGVLFTVARGSAEDRYQSANREILTAVGGSDPDGVACSGDGAPAACSVLRTAAQDKSRAGDLATVGFVAAGVSAAAFGLTYWLWPKADAPVAIQAGAGPGAFRMAISGRF